MPRIFISMTSLVCACLFSFQLSAQTTLPTRDALEPGWNTVVTDGLCSSGTPHRFYVRESSASDRLLIYFNGGGACWFGEACDLNSEPNVHFPFAESGNNNPANFDGLFALDNSDNPLANYDMIVLPYCTGDVHIGGGQRVYSYTGADGTDVSVTTHHNGYENSTTVLDWVYENFDAPDRVVIAGNSAGAIGSSFYSGLIAEHYADVPAVLIADAAGGYGSPKLPVTFEAWRTVSILPNWPYYAGKTSATLTFEDFYIAAVRHSSNLTIAQYNAAEDAVQYSFNYLIGDTPGSFTLPERLFNHYVEIESAVDKFYHYTAGGTVHTILSSPHFYTYEVEGVRFADWVAGLVDGQAVGDVSCVNEARGCKSAPE